MADEAETIIQCTEFHSPTNKFWMFGKTSSAELVYGTTDATNMPAPFVISYGVVGQVFNSGKVMDFGTNFNGFGACTQDLEANTGFGLVLEGTKLGFSTLDTAGSNPKVLEIYYGASAISAIMTGHVYRKDNILRGMFVAYDNYRCLYGANFDTLLFDFKCTDNPVIIMDFGLTAAKEHNLFFLYKNTVAGAYHFVMGFQDSAYTIQWQKQIGITNTVDLEFMVFR